jgi:hypothetical protein
MIGHAVGASGDGATDRRGGGSAAAVGQCATRKGWRAIKGPAGLGGPLERPHDHCRSGEVRLAVTLQPRRRCQLTAAGIAVRLQLARSQSSLVRGLDHPI